MRGESNLDGSEKRELEERGELQESEMREMEAHERRGHEGKHEGGYEGHIGEAHGESDEDTISKTYRGGMG